MNPGKRFGVGDGRIDPEGLPGKLLDGEAVRGVAAGLGSRASVIRESADTMLLKWSVLPQALSGEGLEPLWCGLSAPLNRVISVADRFDSAKTALLRFADKADEHHKAYTVLYADAVAFRAKIDPGVWMPIADTSYWDSCWLDPAAREVEFWQGRGFEARDGNWRTSVEILVEWTQSRALVEENDRLFHRANQLASDISWSEADCVNALNGLSVHGCPVPQRGVDATDLDGWAGQGHNRLPWGGTPDWDHNFGGSVQLGFEDFWDGLKNAAGLIGFDPASGRWSWGTAGRSWSGLVNTFGSAAFVVLFSPMIVPIGFAGLVNPGGTGRVLNDWRHDSVLGAWFLDHLDMAVQNLIGAGQGLVDYEHWGDDPVRAGTATLLNVGTLFVGGGEVLGVTKAGLETVETVVKTGRLAEMAGAGLRVIDKAQDWANQVIHPWRDGTKPLDGVNPDDLTRVHEPEPAPRGHVDEPSDGPIGHEHGGEPKTHPDVETDPVPGKGKDGDSAVAERLSHPPDDKDITKNHPENLTPDQQRNVQAIQDVIQHPNVNEAQRAAIQEVLDNPSLLDNAAKKGNFQEMVDDARMESLGYERLGPESNRITSLTQQGHNGIDAIYYKPGPPPEYIVADQKYATKGDPQLAHTGGGQQLSTQWIRDRLQDYFGDGPLSEADQAHLDTLTDHYQAILDGKPPPDSALVSQRLDVLDGKWSPSHASVTDGDTARVAVIGPKEEG